MKNNTKIVNKYVEQIISLIEKDIMEISKQLQSFDIQMDIYRDKSYKSKFKNILNSFLEESTSIDLCKASKDL
jgi:hypothetical protein